MGNLVCRDCKSTDVTKYTLGIFGDSRHRCNSCGKISVTADFVVPDLFDRITASLGVLAPEFVGMVYNCVCDDYQYYSMLTGDWYETYGEAVAATLARLKDTTMKYDFDKKIKKSLDI